MVIEKKVELGVVYAPILDDWYIALRGYGAFFNGKRLRINNPPSGKLSPSACNYVGKFEYLH